jgi:hypothetical protein
MSEESPKVFKIGIAMAGAVSAGAYTAGVIDYLLESLSKWESAKERNKQLGKDHPEYDRSIPMHDVIIEVIGGSSAGGMTAAITALSLFEGIRPVNDANPQKESNRLYDSWVNLNDDGQGKPTLLQMLTSDDIIEEQGVISLLNSKPINAIAEKAIQLNRVTKLPDYISPSLEVILTITSLRGIPLAINFFDEVERAKSLGEPPKPAHKMFLHKGIAHFKVQTDQEEQDYSYTMPFDPDNLASRQSLIDCAVATGAFPVGLAPRHLRKTSKEYINAMVERMFKPSLSKSQAYGDMKDPGRAIRIEVEEDEFNFFAVDGGTVNNEPFGEIIKALEEKCQYDPGNNYAVLMIDPFPNFEAEAASDREKTPKLVQLVPQILGAIRGQAMMKESDLMGGLSEDHTMRMIFPSRKIDEGAINPDDPDNKKDPYPISCGSLDGFGGFFSREFREHDFQLGRKNCQSFLRNYFCLPLDKAGQDTVFEDWDADDERHKRYYSPDGDGYPIIPDISFDRRRAENPEIPKPERIKLPVSSILALETPIKHRIKDILANINKYDRHEPSENQQNLEDSAEIVLENHYNKSWFQKKKAAFFGRLANWIWKKYGSWEAASILTHQTLKAIIIDFQKRGLLIQDVKIRKKFLKK